MDSIQLQEGIFASILIFFCSEVNFFKLSSP